MKTQMKLFTYMTKPLVLFLLLFALGVGDVWGWNVGSDWIFYFDMQNCQDFGNPWLRVGRDGNNNNYSAAWTMDRVEGTKWLYYKQPGSWDNYGAFSVANKDGWTDANTIYQPYNDNGTVKPNDDHNITKQTNFQKYEFSTNKNCYLKITDNGNNTNSCQYYQVNNHTNNDDGGELVELPMYSVTFNGSPTHGTVFVQKYTKTDGSTKSSISTGEEVYPTQIIEITTTPDTHYALATLTVTGATLISGTTYYVTGNCEITATFDHKWTIKGSDSFDSDDDEDEMGDWKVFNGLPNTGTNTYSGTISLAAHTAYYFKVFDRATNTWYGCGTRDNDYTYVGQTDAVPITSTNESGHNVMLMTRDAGAYTFEWDDDQKKLKILFPTAVKHPSMDYVYMEKYSDWNGGSHTYIHYWYKGTPDVALTDGGVDPKMTVSFTAKSPAKTFYTYPVLTDYPWFIVAEGLNSSGGAGGHATTNEGMETTGHGGHYVYHNGSAWVWATFQVYIKLENQGADEGKKGTLGVPVAFNDTALSARISKPVKTNYDFGGYYTAAEGGGALIIDENGDWQTNVSDYTSASGAWIHAGDTTTLYAKWTETARTITLQVSPEGTGSFTVGEEAKVHGDQITAYISTPTETITATPSHAAYKFKEWRYSEGVGNKDGTGSDNTVQITADRDGTLTAVFEPRFSLVGDKYGSSDKGGMPGWEESAYDDSDAFFTVKGTSPVNLTCTCTLDASTRYEFQVHDRALVKNLGAGSDGEYRLEDKAYVDLVKQDVNVTFTTTGAGRYIFHIYDILENDRPRLEILWPRKVNFGWKYADADAPNTLSEGAGGNVTAYVHEGGVKTAVSYDDYIINGATVSFTAHPYPDYSFAGWWTNYSTYSGEHFATADSTSWVVTTADAAAYAKFVEKTDTLKSGTTWNTGIWSAGHQPTADEVAIIQSPVEVDITTAKAKKVLIMQNSPNTGQLEIPAGKELVVRTTIRKTTDGSTYSATGENDIIIGSTLAGNGALVMGAHDGTNKATVYFATKAKTTGEGEDKHNVNQFIGTPFNDQGAILYNYYGTKIYRFMAAHDGNLGTENEWQRVQSNEGMNGFFGYNILTNQTSSPVLEMTGTLCRTTHTETISGYHKADWDSTENMFANSWVAPIYIPNFKDTCFVNIEKTIYIFNAGTKADQEGHAMNEGTISTTAAGQYCVLPVKSSPWVGLTVIPSMQAFSVFANGENPKLKFDYRELVYNPSTNGTATIVPTRAPRRTATNDPDAPTVLRLAVTGESGYAAKIVLLERTDFSDNFDDGWDGRFMAGDDAAPRLYAVTPDGNMAINSIPNIEGTLLGFKAGEADSIFTFSFDYDGEALYLYDTQTQVYTRVMTGNTYAFTTTDNEAHNRFILTHNAPSVVTGIESGNSPSQVTNKMIIDNHLYIFRGGVLYDAVGRMITNGKEAGL